MAKHGVIDVESYQARQQMLMATDQIKLKYPQQSLLCSKTDTQQSTTLVLFDRASSDIQQVLETLATKHRLEKTKLRLLAHPNRDGGLFQVLYGLPDFYQESIERQQLTPAYLKPLNDFNFDIRWYHSQNWEDSLSLSQFNSDWHSQNLTEFSTRSQNQLNVVLMAENDISALDKVLQQTAGHQLLITSLSPTQSEELLGNKQFALENMQVPLWQRDYQLADQPIAGLMDIVPTMLESRISCAGSHKNYTNGESLQTLKRRWPLVETYSPYIVIYDEKEITILDNSGQFSVYSSDKFELKKQAEPPVPVLIDALKDLKRFSKTEESN
jgi:membrane-anchored protein YejM (alkaline phosphatase superfamily)